MTITPPSPTCRRAALGAIAAVGLTARAEPSGAESMGPAVVSRPGHLILLGDSVFDNGGYLRGSGPDVVGLLRRELPRGWRATLLAKGGSVASDVPGQLGRLPPDATHLVISAGGNDAGRQEGVLGEPAHSVADGLARIAAIRQAFAHDYRGMLDATLKLDLPLAVCTIYDPRFAEPGRRQVAVVALAAFNDIITREAFAHGIALVDLRLVCDRDEDFAAPTGPSLAGGAKIGAAISKWAVGHDPMRRHSEVFAKGERSR
jgi:GDSL-like lipase/acylhydrolase family protein